MTTTTSPSIIDPGLPRPARQVLALLAHLRHGSLDLQTPEGTLLQFGDRSGPRAALRISDWAVCAAVLKSGDVGFAESFVAGHWSSSDLRALLELFIRNRTTLEALIYGGFWGGLLYRLRHLLHRNTRAGSRKNIHAHYDLGNDFYKLWLDPTMNYSSAWFAGAAEGSLDAAQRAKMRRALDAVIDPWIGRLCDRALGRPALAWQLPLIGLLLVAGFAGLFFPLPRRHGALLAWAGAGLVLTYLAYSGLAVLHQAWGARLGGGPARQTRIVAWREGFALVGVVVASLLPSALGFGATAAVLAGALALGLVLLRMSPRPAASEAAAPSLALAWRVPEFRRLLAVYLLNGIAASVPATLLLFFIDDRLRLPGSQGLFLASYFAAAVASLPVWLRVVALIGQARAWAWGMGLAVAGFGWAALLGAGDRTGFLAVCVASGAALGADLAVPGALLAGVIQRAGLQGRAEGAFFGWWNAATKLNLALAAGLALPLLQLLGYAPGQRDATALQALALTYCLLPCLLKLAAAGLLYRHFIASP